MTDIWLPPPRETCGAHCEDRRGNSWACQNFREVKLDHVYDGKWRCEKHRNTRRFGHLLGCMGPLRHNGPCKVTLASLQAVREEEGPL